jgi:uncharacterized protein (TIGR02594 family)
MQGKSHRLKLNRKQDLRGCVFSQILRLIRSTNTKEYPMKKVKKYALALVIAFSSVPAYSITYSTPSYAADLLIAAKPYIGQHERKNRKSLKKSLGVDPVRIKWCGAFMSLVTKRAGYKTPKNQNMARSWASFGKKVSLRNIRKGDVLVMRNHVTIYTRKSKSKVCGVGGNQGNSVKESCYSTGKVIAVRRP